MIEQTFLLGRTDEEKSSVDFLRNLGYIVIEPSPSTKDFLSEEDYKGIKTIPNLVTFFYKRMTKYNKHRNIHYSMATNQDKKYASLFVKRRMSTGISKERALIECAYIIDILLRYEEFFGLDITITSMFILGQDKMKWITDKVIAFINKEKSELDYFVEFKEKEGMIREWGKEEYGIE